MRGWRRMLGIASLFVALGGCALVDARATQRERGFEATHPPSGQFIEVDDRRVHVMIEGDGPDLILLHGASGNLRDFSFDLIDRLKGRYRVIAFDRPGLGFSDDIGAQNHSPISQAEFLRRAADQLDVRDPIVMGHSYGGAVAMAWGMRAPSDTAALVIVSGATEPWPGELQGWYRFVGTPIGNRVGPPLMTALAPMSLGDRIMAGIFAPDAVPAGYADHIGVGLAARRANYRNNARQITQLRPFLRVMSQRYADLDLPVEILHGAEDHVVPAQVHAVPLAHDLPNANLTILPGIGHMPQHADPQSVVDAIDRAAIRAGLLASLPDTPQAARN